MTNRLLVELLADGSFHSGESLGATLGLTRAAVWKRVNALADIGLTVDAVRGKGYRIAGGLSLLSKEAIQRNFSAVVMSDVQVLDIFDTVGSTNEVALSRVRAGNMGCYVCLAEHQTAGRGRRGRQWLSPYAANIYLSMVKNFPGGIAALDGLSLVVGVVVCEALESLGVDGVGLKWPNDIVVGSAKLGGILIEIAGDMTGVAAAVIGVGLNVSISAPAAALLDREWIDLSRMGRGELSRNTLAASLLNGLCPALREFQQQGLAPFLARWRRLDVVVGRRISVLSGDTIISGVAEGIDDAGGLLVRDASGVRAYRGGEVSVRGWV